MAQARPPIDPAAGSPMNWRTWIRPALAVSIVAAPIAVLLQKGGIERDVAGRVAAALAAGGQGWASVSATAQDVRISGTAPSPEATQVATRLAAGVSGVRSVGDGTTLLAVASPYVWSARRTGRQIAFTGSVPSEGVRASLLAAVRRALPQAEIVDNTALARGAPAPFAAAALFALSRLPALSDGVATLTDSSLSISGTAADADAYASFRTAVAKDVPASVDVAAVDV